jgi:hypothetical protein
VIAAHDRARYAVNDNGDIYAVHGFDEKPDSRIVLALVSRQNKIARTGHPNSPVYFYQPPVMVPANNLTYMPGLEDVHLYLANR